MIVEFIKKQRYVSLFYVNANCIVVMCTCVFMMWILFLFSNPRVKQLAIQLYSDFVCEIDIWNNLVQHLTISCFGTQFHFDGVFGKKNYYFNLSAI